MCIGAYFVDEGGELGDWQRGVQLQEAPDVGDEKLLVDFVHEDLELLVVRLHEVLISDAIEVGRDWREELGAGVVEHALELLAVA